MARVNWEDEIEIDERFKALVRRLGNEDTARGMLMRFWKLAQKFWGEEMALVPEEQFELGQFDVLLEVKLAEKRDGGYYARGAETNFDWYLQVCRASKKGVEARAAKPKRQKQPPGEPEGPKNDAPVNRPVNRPVNPPTLTPTLTPALTLTQGKEEIVTPLGAPDGAQRASGRDVIAAYVDAYEKRYGHRPPIQPKHGQLAKSMAATLVTPERVQGVMQTYLAMNDAWFLTKHHDLEALSTNLNKVVTRLETGASTSATQARKAELFSDNANVARLFLERPKGASGD